MSRYFYAKWPFYLNVVGGGLILVFGGVIGAALFELYNLLPLAFLIVVIVAYVTMTSLWAAFLVYDQSMKRTALLMIREAQVQSTDKIVYPYVSEGGYIPWLMSHLTLGQISVIDIYSPQIMPGRNVNRMRQEGVNVRRDRRLVTMPGRIDLIPMQVNSVDIVVLAHVLSAIQQIGDQEILIQEVTRLLKPGGRIIIVAPHRTWMSRLTTFSPYHYTRSEAELTRLLKQNGYVQRQSTLINGFVLISHGTKPSQYQSIQLPLDI